MQHLKTSTPVIHFIVPDTASELDATRRIFEEYAESLQVDLCFQDFSNELRNLPGEYASPSGTLLMALKNGADRGFAHMSSDLIKISLNGQYDHHLWRCRKP